MQATQIKVGQQYAFTTTPRKGIEDLFGIGARRVRVRQMGVERFNPTGGDDHSGSYKRDGIKIDRWDGTNWFEDTDTYKARDFLMPWAPYEAERNKRQVESDAKARERAEQAAQHEDRLEVLRAELRGYDLRHTDDSRWLGSNDPADNHTLDFVIPQGGSRVIMTIEAAERLMASVAERIYEGIRDSV